MVDDQRVGGNPTSQRSDVETGKDSGAGGIETFLDRIGLLRTRLAALPVRDQVSIFFTTRELATFQVHLLSLVLLYLIFDENLFGKW